MARSASGTRLWVAAEEPDGSGQHGANPQWQTQAEAIKKLGDAYNRGRLTPLVKSLFAKWLAWRRS